MFSKLSGIFSPVNYRVILYIIILSGLTALSFNYLNPQGLTLIDISEDPAKDSPGKVEFVQPISINAEEANLLHSKKVTFIDIRSASEFNSGRIPNAINLPFEFQQDPGNSLGSFQKDSPFVLYGSEGSDEVLGNASQQIFTAGFRRIYIYPGGYEEWVRNDFEVSE